MSDSREIKNDFKNYFHSFLEDNRKLKFFFMEIFFHGAIYAVGGFFRDFLNYKNSRDIDLIIDIDNTTLLDIIKNHEIDYTINRHNGIKLKINKIEIDLWSIYDNWAFKNKLVKLNEKDKLLSIAKGCFYNYDSLVINLNNFSYNLQFYSDFINNQTLNIIQKKAIYKTLNPTIEANIIRAFYLKNKIHIDFSENTINYVIKSLKLIESWHKDDFERLLSIKEKYPKYNDLTEIQLFYELEKFKSDIKGNIQLTLF
ncbi:hypothetical protein LPB90_11085 [Chryseobacterium sp. LC2016-29]|uniref:hypothetical protein n=1 Tax=Chryseobacterium sp. LC2016-29 TaxID=2897331 RepID=UPI001E56C483|nr:hypothetical protein [Chryseobacterium sp. LC2016-29]MCD0479004.1 hypothetical protein [Chryseobacterium sp. LC2016-29]